MSHCPPHVYTNVPPAPQADAVNILLLDSLNTGGQDQSYVRNEAIAFLKAMPPGTEVAIFGLGETLDLVERFTSDPAQLLAAFASVPTGHSPATPPLAAGPKSENGQSNLTGNQSRTSASRAKTWSYPGDAHVVFKRPDIRARMTLEALDDLARFLAAVPGRKNVIWISDEFPVIVFPSLSQKQDLENMPEVANHARRTADALTRARVAIYPIEAEGMMNDTLAQASNPLPGMATRPSPAAGSQAAGLQGGESRIPMGNVVMSEYQEEAAKRADKIYSMERIASDTGGKAFYNTNDLNTAMARAVRDGSRYYTLIYTPSNSKLDGTYRHIEVKLAGCKCKLSYRHGYNADEVGGPASIAEDRHGEDKHVAAAAPAAPDNPLLPLMRPGMPDSTEILYGIRVVPAASQPAPGVPRAGKNDNLAGPITRYTADFMIRWTDIRFSPVEDGPQKGKEAGRIQIELLAYSPDGTALNWNGGTQEMQLDPVAYASIQKSGIPAHLEIDVPQGKDFYLSTGVYDWRTEKAGTLQIPIQAVPAQTAAAGAAVSR